MQYKKGGNVSPPKTEDGIDTQTHIDTNLATDINRMQNIIKYQGKLRPVGQSAICKYFVVVWQF